MTCRILCLALLLTTALLPAGCGGRTDLPQSQSESGVPNMGLVTDIPIPANATMDNERSLILIDRDHWTGRMVMRFWQGPAELTAFYQSQMPAYGWEPVMSATSSTTVLSYLRSDRAATVQIEKSMLGFNSVVSVTVAPRQQGGSGSSGGGMTEPGATRAPARPDVQTLPSRR
jgi:hypothetical protein